MPKVTIKNNRDRRFPVRHDEGVTQVPPGATREFTMADSLARYYENTRDIAVTREKGETETKPPERQLADMSTAELNKIADDEGIDISNVADDSGRVATIQAFRLLFGDNNVDELKAIAEREQVDLGEAKRKPEIVNAILAKRGVAPATT